MSLPASHFEALYADDPDPWAFRTRWYERRKRALLLACLPRPRFAHGFEPACANGELSIELAQRCDELLCSDPSATAVSLARQRLANCDPARVYQGGLPQDWPAGCFDLVVLSELGYYLDAESWRLACERAAASLERGAALAACHWRHPIQGCELAGDAVHALLAEAMGAPARICHLEPDFRLELWFDDNAGAAP